MNPTITPETITAILAKANQDYSIGLQRNANHPLIQGCRLGTVFVNQEGDYCVFTGIDGGNRRYPVMYTRVRDRAPRKATMSYLAKIRRASQEG